MVLRRNFRVLGSFRVLLQRFRDFTELQGFTGELQGFIGSFRVLLRSFRVLLGGYKVLLRSFRILLRSFRVLLGCFRVLMRSFRVLLRSFRVLLGCSRVLLRSFRVLLRSFRVLPGSFRLLLRSFRVYWGVSGLYCGASGKFRNSLSKPLSVPVHNHNSLAPPTTWRVTLIFASSYGRMILTEVFLCFFVSCKG